LKDNFVFMLKTPSLGDSAVTLPSAKPIAQQNGRAAKTSLESLFSKTQNQRKESTSQDSAQTRIAR
jgi:hypothetical protein